MAEQQGEQELSRYQQVQMILNEAAVGAAAEYQGYGNFWETLPLDQFTEVVIFGVRMIAPAGHADGRGAASGLVKGLKGEYPFDGSRFPRLPWGSDTVVSTSNIQFIERWIDDGCPGVDEVRASVVAGSESSQAALACGDAAHPLCTRPVNDVRGDIDGVMVRKNIENLSDEELERLRAAIREMHRYDDFFQDERSWGYWGRIHANSCQHGWEEFLPWHRLYLYEFEQRLQDIDSRITLPYWEWSRYAQQNRVLQGLDSGAIPQAYHCWLDAPALERLRANSAVPAEDIERLASVLGPENSANSGDRYLQKAGIDIASNPAATDAIMAELQDVNQLWHRWRWPGPGGDNLEFQDYPNPADIQRILQIENFFDFGSGPTDNHFFGANERIHNLMHNFSGGRNPNFDDAKFPDVPETGDMVNPGRTAFDPIFWGHHSNVDRLWAAWQQKHPNRNPDNLTTPLPPWALRVGDMLNTHALGYEYAKSTHHFETDQSMSMTRFRSDKTGVTTTVLNTHDRAEIRLHNVVQVGQGGLIRAFLNHPEANASTPTQDNDHFVGQFHTFAGPCIGGPGHCAVPQPSTRRFDLRHRHHKMATVIRFDATETVQKLRDQGETDFDVHLVILGVGGAPADNVLKLKGVSLNFFD